MVLPQGGVHKGFIESPLTHLRYNNFMFAAGRLKTQRHQSLRLRHDKSDLWEIMNKIIRKEPGCNAVEMKPLDETAIGSRIRTVREAKGLTKEKLL